MLDWDAEVEAVGRESSESAMDLSYFACRSAVSDRETVFGEVRALILSGRASRTCFVHQTNACNYKLDRFCIGELSIHQCLLLKLLSNDK